VVRVTVAMQRANPVGGIVESQPCGGIFHGLDHDLKSFRVIASDSP